MPQHYIPLAGSERAPLPGALMGAAADPQEQMQVTVMVRPRSPLAARPQTQPQFRPMSRDEFRAAHGADRGDLAKVEQFARQHELRVSEVNDVHRTIKLTGTVANFSRAFDVELRQYSQAGRRYRGRTGAVNIPSGLASVVEGVFGLDNRPAARPHCLMRATRAAAAAAGGVAVSAASAVGDTLTAPQMASLYNFPAGRTGAGQAIGIIELGGGINTSDLGPYFSQFGQQAPNITIVSVDGGQSVPDPNDNDATLEVMLDVEIAGAVAPQANMAVYFAPNTDQSFLNAVNSAVHDSTNNPSVISISWGQSEDNWTATARKAMDGIIQAAATLGITVCCASGDNGSPDAVSDGSQHVDFPSSSPSALACGGTSVSANGNTILDEVVWNNGPGEISGGGISDQFTPQPAYQTGVVNQASANPGAGPGRGVPDVSGHAASFQILFFGQTTQAAGTSGVAPMWAGLMALVNEGISPRKVGAPHARLYANPAAFRDIVNGNNGAYVAGPGWDACTGLGSPNGTAIAGLF